MEAMTPPVDRINGLVGLGDDGVVDANGGVVEDGVRASSQRTGAIDSGCFRALTLYKL